MVIRGRSGSRFWWGVRCAKSAWGVVFVKNKAHGWVGPLRSTDSGAICTLHPLPERALSKRKTPKKAKPKTLSGGADMSTAEATVATLLAHGFKTVYALPGVH